MLRAFAAPVAGVTLASRADDAGSLAGARCRAEVVVWRRCRAL